MRSFLLFAFLLHLSFKTDAQQIVYLECDGKFFPLVNGAPDYSVWVSKSSILAPKDTSVPNDSIIWGACMPEMIDDAIPELNDTFYVLYSLTAREKIIHITAGKFDNEEIEVINAQGIKMTVPVHFLNANTRKLDVQNLPAGSYSCRISRGEKIVAVLSLKIAR